jgi:hypothetical protein
MKGTASILPAIYFLIILNPATGVKTECIAPEVFKIFHDMGQTVMELPQWVIVLLPPESGLTSNLFGNLFAHSVWFGPTLRVSCERLGLFGPLSDRTVTRQLTGLKDAYVLALCRGADAPDVRSWAELIGQISLKIKKYLGIDEKYFVIEKRFNSESEPMPAQTRRLLDPNINLFVASEIANIEARVAAEKSPSKSPSKSPFNSPSNSPAKRLLQRM